MADYQGNGKNNVQLLQELETLSQSLYQSHTARRTASLVLPRTAPPLPPEGVSAVAALPDVPREPRPHSRRMSLSPWRTRPKHQPDQDEGRDRDYPQPRRGGRPQSEEPAPTEEKKGIWNWKPMRALSHIGMQRLGCLFSVEVISVQGLPASMNGLRLSVAVRKKETKDGTVQTMPSRVLLPPYLVYKPRVPVLTSTQHSQSLLLRLHRRLHLFVKPVRHPSEDVCLPGQIRRPWLLWD